MSHSWTQCLGNKLIDLLLRPPVAADGPGPGHLGERDRDEGEGGQEELGDQLQPLLQ